MFCYLENTFDGIFIGIDSKTCGFIDNSLEWKIAHSTVKPWNEEVTTSETVEIDEEAFQERVI